jgi:hypothetical protein
MDIDYDKAVEQYIKHLAYVRNYNATHKEENKLRHRNYYYRIKSDPDKYELYLARRRNDYKAKKLSESSAKDTAIFY